jgi:hypothetical protein
MKVIKVEQKYSKSFLVVFTLKTFGNKRFEIGQTADDEISAYALAIPRIEKLEREELEKKLNEWETIKKAIPSANVGKYVKKYQKLLGK